MGSNIVGCSRLRSIRGGNLGLIRNRTVKRMSLTEKINGLVRMMCPCLRLLNLKKSKKETLPRSVIGFFVIMSPIKVCVEGYMCVCLCFCRVLPSLLTPCLLSFLYGR